ncbi:MAG: Smr/MutS family protein [Myxococcota bacterium]|nr:Smr/MutS family protein [Myxococcota bacterium]
MLIHDSTLEALDWAVLREAQADLCATNRARSRVRANDFADSRSDALRRYRAVAELWLLEDLGQRPSLNAIHDVSGYTSRAAKGEVLEPHELVEVGQSLGAMAALQTWVMGAEADVPELHALVEPIAVDVFILRNLEDSFTPAGELSDAYYPELRSIRTRTDALRSAVQSTLHSMLNDPAMADLFHDRYITDRGGRLVIPVRSAARKRLGIVHDTSQSGETAFVEPHAVVDQQNELKGLEAEWRRTVTRILTELSREVGEAHRDIEASIEAASTVDLAQSRARLGRTLGGCIPEVGSASQIQLRAARHPVLVLRGLDVVPNRIDIDDDRRGIILTGPNAGGKTITLKTVGLMALMVRAAIPIPAREDSRIDWMDPIWAVVGDQQDVSDDLSTFSSHLVALRSAIERAQPGALVLLDEIAIGTDPKQGAALAQAVVEHLVEAECRTVVTTHFTELKELAAEHPAMALMGAVFADGRPTFRMEPDRVGRSHALAVARTMGMPSTVVDRAVSLLDSESKRMDDLLTQIESDRERIHQTRTDLDERVRAFEFERTRLNEREARLNARRDREDALDRDAFRAKLKEHERTIKDRIKMLQGGGIREAQAALDDVKRLRKDAQPAPPKLPPTDDVPIHVGDTVRLLLLNELATVVSIKGAQIEVEIRGKRLRASRATVQFEKRSKPAAIVAPKPLARGPSGPVDVRTDANTLDLRGKRVHEALDDVEAFLDGLSLTEHACGYLLHGHGTGALKTALRQWLPKSRFGRRWRAGGPDDGGDAFTVVEL